jgi:hypothetical protein
LILSWAIDNNKSAVFHSLSDKMVMDRNIISKRGKRLYSILKLLYSEIDFIAFCAFCNELKENSLPFNTDKINVASFYGTARIVGIVNQG